MGVSCARDKPPLYYRELLGSGPNALIERLGEPDGRRREKPGMHGFMTWNDFRETGVRAMVMIQKGKVTYVAYTFRGMKEFDQNQALAVIGLSEPGEEPHRFDGSRAVSWRPFEEYDKLVINPDTKLIGVGDKLAINNEIAENEIAENQ
jgi:hypothetical protein